VSRVGGNAEPILREGLIQFPHMYSAYDGAHDYEVTPSVPLAAAGIDPAWDPLDPSSLEWEVDDVFVADHGAFAELPGGRLLQTKRAGNTLVKVTGMTRSGVLVRGEAPLTISAAAPDEWAAGDARYNNGISVDWSMRIAEAVRTGVCVVPAGLGQIAPVGACTTCHASPSALGNQPTPTQLALYSDGALEEIFARAALPAGGAFTSPYLRMLDPQTADCAYLAFHTWDVDERTRRGLIWKLRSLPPRSDPVIDARRTQVPVTDRHCVDTAGYGGTATPGASVMVTVPFRLDQGRTCQEMGVDAVRVELGDMTYVATAPCGDGQVQLLNVLEGSYALHVVGLNAGGIVVADDFSSSVKTLTVRGPDAMTGTEPATLTAAPAQLLLRWDLGWGRCTSFGIDHFAVTLRRPATADSLLETTLACALEGDDVGRYRRIPDPERRVAGSEPGAVSVQPKGRNGAAVGSESRIMFDAPGAGHEVRMTLDCSSAVCASTGKPD